MSKLIAAEVLRAPYATPSVRKFARELGVDIAKVRGLAPHGRISVEDVQAFVREAIARLARPENVAPAAARAAPTRTIDFANFGDVERRPLSDGMQIYGAKLLHAWSTIPHVTNFDEADVTEWEVFRLALNDLSEFGRVAFLMKALSTSLRKFPSFNASLDGSHLVLKSYVHIGFRVETSDGEIELVVRNVDKKSLRDIAREAAHLVARAEAKLLVESDLQGGCISLSDLGEHGGLGFTPIISAPEIAILGVGRIAARPRWNGHTFERRLMLPLCLSWDHRAVDGAAAGRFLADLAATLGDFRRVLL